MISIVKERKSRNTQTLCHPSIISFAHYEGGNARTWACWSSKLGQKEQRRLWQRNRDFGNRTRTWHKEHIRTSAPDPPSIREIWNSHCSSKMASTKMIIVRVLSLECLLVLSIDYTMLKSMSVSGSCGTSLPWRDTVCRGCHCLFILVLICFAPNPTPQSSRFPLWIRISQLKNRVKPNMARITTKTS